MEDLGSLYEWRIVRNKAFLIRKIHITYHRFNLEKGKEKDRVIHYYDS